MDAGGLAKRKKGDVSPSEANPVVASAGLACRTISVTPVQAITDIQEPVECEGDELSAQVPEPNGDNAKADDEEDGDDLADDKADSDQSPAKKPKSAKQKKSMTALKNSKPATRRGNKNNKKKANKPHEDDDDADAFM